MSVFSDSITPDVKRLISVIRRERKPDRVYFIELFLDDEVKEAVVQRFHLDERLDPGDPHYGLQKEIELHRFLGYEVFRVPVIHKDFFKMAYVNTQDTTQVAGQHRGVREWTEEHGGPIQTWEDFERYPWPKVSDIDFGALEWLEKNLPENMGIYDLTAHILEMVTFLMGYETFAYNLVDAPDLVDALAEKVGRFYMEYTGALCDFSCVPLVWGSDDMGFRSGTLASPNFLKKKILPWHRACAEVAHQKGKPYLLHNCGNIENIMEALIEDVGIDGRHSFEDTILPVTEAYGMYGHRIAILGGIDVDFLCRAPEEEIRKRVRETLDVCMQGNGYCLGTGNTVANYMPLESYLVMLDEGRRYRV